MKKLSIMKMRLYQLYEVNLMSTHKILKGGRFFLEQKDSKKQKTLACVDYLIWGWL